MSSTKWFKLFDLLHQLKPRFPSLENNIAIRWIWSDDDWGSKKISYYYRLPDPEKELNRAADGFEINDGTSFGGPGYLREIFEIYIPIGSKEVLTHQLIPPTTTEHTLFPNLKEFLEAVDQKGLFPYRMEEDYRDIPDKEDSKESSSTPNNTPNKRFTFYKNIIFFGYSTNMVPLSKK